MSLPALKAAGFAGNCSILPLPTVSLVKRSCVGITPEGTRDFLTDYAGEMVLSLGSKENTEPVEHIIKG